MKKYKFFEKYLNDIVGHLRFNTENNSKLVSISKIFKIANSKKKKIIFLGNGGSAAMASHVSVDLTKNANIRAINFNEADLITCLSNDHGYENWMKSALELYCDKGDIVVLISTSGASQNILKAAEWCVENKKKLISFTGRRKNNKLKLINKRGINLWVNSNSYNHVEMVHHIWLLGVVDYLIGNSEYEPK
jgi:D-sedoheptulose 7-phosphate isomerase